MGEDFGPENFFTLEDFPFREIFAGVCFIWEVIPKIEKFTGGRLLKGRNCRIAKNSLIRGGVVLGDNVTIGHSVELKNCLIMSNTNVAHLNYVGDSLVGNKVNIGAGVVLANFRLDEQEVMIKINGKKYKTGLMKMGAVIGDGSKIGANSVLNPGTILGKNCQVYPLVSVCGVHKENAVIKKLK